MSKTNKITRLINKIYHRPKPADAETSVGLDDNTNIPSRKNKKKITLLQKRLLWCLAGVVLLIAGYFWWRMPAKMRVVVMIPYDIHYHILPQYTPLGLYCWSKIDDISRVILYGWDGKKCWSKQLLDNSDIQKMICSSDGHYVVLCTKEKNVMNIYLLQDGKLSEKVPVLINDKLGKLNIFALNSGRIWLYYENSSSTYAIKAIDGINVASGSLPLRHNNTEIGVNALHFYSDVEIIGENQVEGFQYWKLSVNNNKVSVDFSNLYKNRYFSYKDSCIIKDNVENFYNIYGKIIYKPSSNWKRLFVTGTNGNLLSLRRYLLNNEKEEIKFIYLPTGKQWYMPPCQYMDLLCGTQDGNHILTRDFEVDNFLKSISDLISGLVITDENFDIVNFELSTYNNTGVKEGSFPLKMDKFGNGSFSYYWNKYQLDGDDFVLSPDGKSLGTTCYNKTKNRKYFYVIIGK